MSYSLSLCTEEIKLQIIFIVICPLFLPQLYKDSLKMFMGNGLTKKLRDGYCGTVA